jgi:hypothetical protein
MVLGRSQPSTSWAGSSTVNTVRCKKMNMELNKKANTNVDVECRECKRKTKHLILASADIAGSERLSWGYEMYWGVSNQIVQCQGCATISFRRVSSDSESPPIQVGPEEYEHDELIELFPNPNEGRRALSDSHILPSKVKRVYEETIKSLNNEQPVLCGIGIRALIEAVAKEKQAPSRDLYGKINDLVSQGVLTQEGADILHKLRTLGNDAAHEVKPHSDRQLGLAMDVVDHLLQGVYILPHYAGNTF